MSLVESPRLTMSDTKAHPIIFLWAHPRSMSTAMERIMRERGDFKCFHEPFMYDYYVHRKVEHMPLFDVDPSAPVRYEDIKVMLLEQSQSSPVFIKDMSYYVVPRLFSDIDFARRLTHTFLIRHPVYSILSYFKLDHRVTLEQIGIEAQYRHVTWLKQNLRLNPLILDAEEVRQNTRATIIRYWQQLGLEIRTQAFDWDANHLPQDWQQVSGWHGNVSQSQGIRKASAENDFKRQQDFDRLAEQHPRLKALLAHHLPFYKKLKKMALTSRAAS